MPGGQLLPIAIYSKKLSYNERILSSFVRELLAKFTSVVKFRHLIDENMVTLFVVHKPGVSAFYSSKIPESDNSKDN